MERYRVLAVARRVRRSSCRWRRDGSRSPRRSRRAPRVSTIATRQRSTRPRPSPYVIAARPGVLVIEALGSRCRIRRRSQRPIPATFIVEADAIACAAAHGLAPVCETLDASRDSPFAGPVSARERRRRVPGAPTGWPLHRCRPPAAPAQPAAGRCPAAGQRYTGHPVSLDFQGADLRSVLRTFAEISGLNVVIDPSIQGTVDVSLRDVPWDQALDIILRANRLGYVGGRHDRPHRAADRAGRRRRASAASWRTSRRSPASCA